MAIFSDFNNEFRILDYSPTHSQLLIRSLKRINREYNIDIILKGMVSILAPTFFNGIEISIVQSKDRQFLIEDYGFVESNDYKIFSLRESSGKVYFLNAMCFGVYHNNLDILETSIGRYYMDDLGELILWC